MNDPWRQWEQNTEANRLLGLYAERGSETPFSRIALDADAGAEESPNKESKPKDKTREAHAIMLALGWIEPAWSESSARGKPLGYKLVAAGKEWQQKRAMRLANQLEEAGEESA